MKKWIVALGASCLATTAMAESKVTLYGAVDLNLEYVNKTGHVPSVANGLTSGTPRHKFTMSNGGLSGSRFGLRGSEKLTDDLSAIFVLEGGFYANSGLSQQGGRLFGRQAFVGLKSNDYGQLTFGRQYSTMFSAMGKFLPIRYSTMYEPTGLISGAFFRQDNTVKYMGNFGGFTAMAHWSFGIGGALPKISPDMPVIGDGKRESGSSRKDMAFGLGMNYHTGPIGFGIGYDNWTPTVGDGRGLVEKLAFMGSYKFSENVSVMGGYRWGRNKDQNNRTLLRDDFYWIGGQYKVTPKLELMVEYDYQNVKKIIGQSHFGNPWQASLMANYSMSKRTSLYLTTAYSRNAGLTLDSAANGYAISLANNKSYALGNGQKSMTGVAVGIRHWF